MKHRSLGFGKGLVEVWNILGYGSASLVDWWQMFQDSIVVISARVECTVKNVYCPLIKIFYVAV
jgi:hypothetical protein